MNNPTPVPPPPPPVRNPRGSLGIGVAWAWAMLVGGYVVVMLVASAFAGTDNAGVYVVLLVLPWIGLVALIGWFLQRGQPRTAAGVAIGIGSILAVALLLVAACFGLLSNTNWH